MRIRKNNFHFDRIKGTTDIRIIIVRHFFHGFYQFHVIKQAQARSKTQFTNDSYKAWFYYRVTGFIIWKFEELVELNVQIKKKVASLGQTNIVT
ncbi:46314_t:CDS:2 [Gigaspora margarita]|uniref:46314_t:CDS:1 n=1 Tax=Gigaspora margarita TaxID=4874 RepID=A0ABM8W2Q6_GIGMA|nr:46314_t:CDS:2 [Gigaspora margarita]